MFAGLRLVHWKPEARPDGVLVLTLDRADENVNALNRAVIDELDAMLERIELELPKGIVIRSGKAAGFVPGADIKGFEQIEAKGQVEDWIRRGQLIFERLARLRCPTVAAIHGHCMGGGTELSLACRYRVASNEENTRIGLPEVKLGHLSGLGWQCSPSASGRRSCRDGHDADRSQHFPARPQKPLAWWIKSTEPIAVATGSSTRFAATWRTNVLSNKRLTWSGQATRGPGRKFLAPQMLKQVDRPQSPQGTLPGSIFA